MWEKKEFVLKGKKHYFFLTPSVNGLRWKIKTDKDLKDSEKCLASILFPVSNKRSQDLSEVSVPIPGTSQRQKTDDNETVVIDFYKEKEKTLKMELAAERLVKSQPFQFDLEEGMNVSVEKLKLLCSESSTYPKGTLPFTNYWLWLWKHPEQQKTLLNVLVQ